ncbi:angiopoietin-like protein 8 [Astyanax mexicanus]|uniref:Angiopoietin-like protein 8 n=1 Tax=Astyanax mexicanus TaxID=7994 RepID=A0A8T2MAC8_ASTMX|nr:angiopoietin-like protein 8 [Astyanax mexicanus]KAG9280104.1 angiopoietin-like protein 8 [Astyanax mexicanus]
MWTVVCVSVSVCVLASGVSPSPLRTRRDAPLAKADEVNVLMYGVLQFSESLHHMYQSTEARLARVARAIHNTESVVQRLGLDTQQAIRTESQIKQGLSLIKEQMEVLQAEAQQTRGVVNRVEQEDTELKLKLRELEQNLSILTSPNRISALRETTQKHNTLLDDLTSWTRQHKQQLENQNLQLLELQKQSRVLQNH